MIMANKRTPYQLNKIKNDYKNLGISLSSTVTPLISMERLITANTPDHFSECFDSKSTFMMVLEYQDSYPDNFQIISGNHFFEKETNVEHTINWVKRIYKKRHRKNFSAQLAHVYVSKKDMTCRGILFTPREKNRNNMIKILT